MNQDQVKEKMLELKENVEYFSLIFSGKESKKVNGLYKPETKEIIIHNKNHQNDNQIIYTAIHEFAHHVQFTVSPIPISSRAHTSKFWNIFHTLLITAEEKGIFQNIYKTDKEFVDLTNRIKSNYLFANAKLMKEFGGLLFEAMDLCEKKGTIFEDYVSRELLMERNTAKTLVKVSKTDIDPNIGFDNMKTLTRIKDNKERQMAEIAFKEGKSPDMVKEQIKTKTNPADPLKLLENEKNRIEKTINTLQQKLDQIEKRIIEIKE